MKTLLVLASAGLITAIGSLEAAQAQPNPIQGTPGSVFPEAAPNEVQIINGVPCRTVLVPGTNSRVPVECAGPAATGSIGPYRSNGPTEPPVSGPPGYRSPYAPQ